jgi:hypothetical protein
MRPGPIPPPPPPPPPYYYYGGGWDYYDNDDWVAGVMIGTVVGGAVVASTDDDDYHEHEHSTTTTTTVVNVPGTPASTPLTTLPCQPQVVSSQGIDYYLCGSQYYVQAYGIDGPMYMPVSPPAG